MLHLHARRRKKWIELGMPQWPSSEQNDQIRVASELVEEPLEMQGAGDMWDASIALPAQAVAGVTCTVH